MLVPVKDAGKKTCPMLRQEASIYAKCLGPQCMAWRWFQEVGLCDGDTDNAIGFCGLADRIERGII